MEIYREKFGMNIVRNIKKKLAPIQNHQESLKN